MTQYELLVVLPGTLEETEVSRLVQQAQDIVSKHGGTDVTTHDRGKSRLAYPMRHIRYGYFHIIHFRAEGSALPEIQKELSLTGEYLRAFITTFDPDMRAETQKKLGRTQEGPMKTLSSVFERFGGEKAAPSSEDTDSARAPKPSSSSEEAPTPKDEGEVEAQPLAMEDIDKKLDELLEGDLKQV